MIYTSYSIIDYNHYALHAWIIRCQRVPMKSRWSLKPSCSSSKMISTRPQSSNAFNRQDGTVVCDDMYHRLSFAKASEYRLGKAIFIFHHFHANSLAMSLLWLPVRPVHSFSVQKWTIAVTVETVFCRGPDQAWKPFLATPSLIHSSWFQAISCWFHSATAL